MQSQFDQYSVQPDAQAACNEPHPVQFPNLGTPQKSQVSPMPTMPPVPRFSDTTMNATIRHLTPGPNVITHKHDPSDHGTRIVEDRTISQDDTGGDTARESRMLAALGRGQVSSPTSNHALQSYEMQLMLLESKNKKRLLLARQEQDQLSNLPASNMKTSSTLLFPPPVPDVQPYIGQYPTTSGQDGNNDFYDNFDRDTCFVSDYVAQSGPPKLIPPPPPVMGYMYATSQTQVTSGPPQPIPPPPPIMSHMYETDQMQLKNGPLVTKPAPYGVLPPPPLPQSDPSRVGPWRSGVTMRPSEPYTHGNKPQPSSQTPIKDKSPEVIPFKTQSNRTTSHQEGMAAALSAMIDQMKGMEIEGGWKQALADHLSLMPKPEESANEPAAPWPILHRIDCPLGSHSVATYMDAPKWVLVENHYHLDGRQRIVDERTWEDGQNNAPFVVYLTYSCASHGHESIDTTKEHRLVVEKDREIGPKESRKPLDRHLRDCCEHPQTPLHAPIPQSEEVRVLSSDLRMAMREGFMKDQRLGLYQPPSFPTRWTLEAPYLINYHCRKQLELAPETFASSCKPEFKLMLDYLERQTVKHEAEANETFARGEVIPSLMPYLFGPDELLTLNKDSSMIATKLTGLLKQVSNLFWALECEYIGFNGEFGAYSKIEDFEYPDLEGATVKIRDLKIFPLKYAGEEKIKSLRKRGELFHSCSGGKYVTGPEKYRSDTSSTRYMVDVKTYRMMHNKADSFTFTRIVQKSHDDDFILRLPSKVSGFHMLDKKWVELAVDQLAPVDWDMSAFENLAVDDNTKELIQAVVTNKIEADKGTDLVSGKGNGLIVLLHGGPGTGKTLTAESVAEIAQKPLYRVSCGDVGTDPHKVEEYLESVFVLGRRWGCVVLLDEADVFLEQRSFANLERNALVSVFLRVLEYYDGILLLTSNRVGTFDEAFKSRIQLAIHYDSLSATQRFQIWGNFIKRLENLQEEMDTENVKVNLEQLSRFPLNGRQIRNVVTTARQLARYRKEPMDFTHLERAISVSSKFEKYLLELHDYEPDDERARAEGLR